MKSCSATELDLEILLIVLVETNIMACTVLANVMFVLRLIYWFDFIFIPLFFLIRDFSQCFPPPPRNFHNNHRARVGEAERLAGPSSPGRPPWLSEGFEPSCRRSQSSALPTVPHNLQSTAGFPLTVAFFILKTLQDLIEKVVILRKAVQLTQAMDADAVGALLAEKMSQYANLLASQGSIAAALAFLPANTNQVRERLTLFFN